LVAYNFITLINAWNMQHIKILTQVMCLVLKSRILLQQIKGTEL
jgi:hypothetical protein